MAFLDDLFDPLAEIAAKEIENRTFNKNCLPVLAFDRCLLWTNEMKKTYPHGETMVVFIKENPDPRNENDKLCVIVALLDAENKPITVDGKKAISTIFHAGTIDKKMIDLLNGNQSIMYKL